jgi:hypothetical protein
MNDNEFVKREKINEMIRGTAENSLRASAETPRFIFTQLNEPV